MRNAFINNLLEYAKSDKDIMLLSGDLGLGCLDEFIKTLPNQYINCGISEQNMLSVAAGLAIEGKKVFVYSIANFPSMRCLEQIRNDCAYHELNVNIICVGAGFSYGALGMSHHATEDIAIMRALPNVEIFSPADKSEAVFALKHMLNHHGVSYIRLGKGKEKDLNVKNVAFENKVVDGQAGVVLCTGAIIGEALLANEKYQKITGNSFQIYSILKIKPINDSSIVNILADFSKVIIVEEHNRIGGLSSIISEILTKNGMGTKVVSVAINDCYASIVGDQNYLRKVYNLDSEYILTKMLES